MAQGAFAANTLRAWKADWAVFTMSCRAYRLESLPATPKTVRAFVFECLGKGKKPATVRRYVSTIGRAHRASGVADPTASEDVRLALKEIFRPMKIREGDRVSELSGFQVLIRQLMAQAAKGNGPTARMLIQQTLRLEESLTEDAADTGRTTTEVYPLTTADRARALAAFVKKCEVTKT